MTAPLGGTAPYWRSVPSGSRTAGPNATSPVAASSGDVPVCRDRSRRSAADLSSGSSRRASATSQTQRRGPSPRTGAARAANRCPGTPSDSPSASSRTVSACTAAAVPPTVNASADRTVRRGAVERLPGRGVGDPAAQPAGALLAPMRERVCPPGTCRTTSPGRLSPPVPSRSTSQARQPSLGPGLPHQRRLPRVDADAVDPAVQRAAPPRSAARPGQPEQHAVAGLGRLGEAEQVPAARRGQPSGRRPPRRALNDEHANAQATMASRRSVAKTTASSLSVRGVATSVPAGSTTGLGLRRGQPERDSARAAAGGNSVMPIRSRNVR